MVDQVVAGRPVAGLRRQPVATFARAAFHLHHVRLDVMGEVVGAVMLQCRVHRTLGGGIVAGFLVREGPDALEAVVGRQIGRPVWGEAVGLLADLLRLAVAEPGGIADAAGEQVGGVRVENLPPDGE